MRDPRLGKVRESHGDGSATPIATETDLPPVAVHSDRGLAMASPLLTPARRRGFVSRLSRPHVCSFPLMFLAPP